MEHRHWRCLYHWRAKRQHGVAGNRQQRALAVFGAVLLLWGLYQVFGRREEQ